MKKKVLVPALSILLILSAAFALSEAIPAKDWAEKFPDQYNSYKKNANNTETYDYVAAHPQIAVLYEGSGFAYSYFSPRGHEYTLEDVQNIGRPHPLANCLTCKSGDYTAMVNEMGIEAYKLPFEETFSKLGEPVGCYNCHGNEVPALQVTHDYLQEAVGQDGINPKTLSCAQCHVEYYFPEDTKATTLAYDSLENASPEAIYARYQELGFTDFVNPRTGSKMIKVQHPEFETYMGEGGIHKGLFSCADCHMGKAENQDSQLFSSHHLVTPVNSYRIAEGCSSCHPDMKGFVKSIQEKTEARTYLIADKLVALTNALAVKVEEKAPESELEALRALNREAQFYWDFVFVENSEGAHNSRLSTACLDRSEELTDKALFLISQ